jgi:hypothetical protein
MEKLTLQSGTSKVHSIVTFISIATASCIFELLLKVLSLWLWLRPHEVQVVLRLWHL